MITCERCEAENKTSRCPHCGHRTVINEDMESIKQYLTKARQIVDKEASEQD